jgi:hypothetical protein
MTAVTLLLDPDKLLMPQAGSICVDSISDYAPACLEIRSALQGIHSVTLHVTQKSTAVWLSEYATPYGDERVRQTTVTPRSILSGRWGIAIPAGITDSEIRQSRLLDEEIIPRTGQGFGEALLEYFYGDGYSFLKFPLAHLAVLLNARDPLRQQDAATRPLVVRAFRDKMEQWEKSAPQEAVKTLIRRLRDDPAGLRRDLCHYKVLRNYPVPLGQKVLGDTWDVFSKARVDASEIALSAQDEEWVSNEVVYYLTSQTSAIKTPEDLRALLDQISGWLDKEYVFVEGLLRSHLEWLSSELLQKVEATFRPLQGRASASLAQLRRLIRPTTPTAPDPEWSAAQWLHWASAVYMPYYGWLEAAGQSDETVMGYATQFADWYYARFNALKYSEQDKFAFSGLYRNRTRMTEGETVTLVLLIDNFNYVHFQELCRLFSQLDFTLQASEPLLSLIPTATEVGKASLIASTGDQTDLPSDTYAGLVKKEWGSVLGGKSTAYLPFIGELQNLTAREHDVYFLNYLPIDQALHEDARTTGRSHAEAIRECLRTLTEAVADFAHRFHVEDRLVVFALSDHGATRIARDTVNVLDQDYFKKLALEKHHRFVALSDDAFAKLPQMAEAQCYLIDRHKFKTNQNYLAARSYYRFLDTTDTFFVHGGLTPEEVVVPFARFEVAPLRPSAPTVRLLKPEYRYAKRSPVEIEIGNPNAYTLESMSLRLIDQDSEEVILASLAANAAEPVGLPTIFRKIPSEGNTRTVTLRVRFECQGRSFTSPDVLLDITLKSIMEVSDDFDL